jgi:hypothetical protein
MPPKIEDVARAFYGTVRMGEVLGQIARGRADNGRPLAAETSRQLAREVLTELGLSWPQGNKDKDRKRG